MRDNRTQPGQVRLVNCTWVVCSESKTQCAILHVISIGDADVDAFADANRPTAETNAFDTIDSFGASAIVRQSNVNAVRRMKQNRPTLKRCDAQLIYTIIA